MIIFDDSLVTEYMEWKNANPENFSWWSFVNIKADIQTALAFAKFFSPETVEIDECIFLKAKFSQDLYEAWRKDCDNEKTCIEKMMNMYQLRDFFHINTQTEENETELIVELGNVLKHYWTMNLNADFPNRPVEVEVFEEDDGEWFITVYEKP